MSTNITQITPTKHIMCLIDSLSIRCDVDAYLVTQFYINIFTCHSTLFFLRFHFGIRSGFFLLFSFWYRICQLDCMHSVYCRYVCLHFCCQCISIVILVAKAQCFEKKNTTCFCFIRNRTCNTSWHHSLLIFIWVALPFYVAFSSSFACSISFVVLCAQFMY